MTTKGTEIKEGRVRDSEGKWRKLCEALRQPPPGVLGLSSRCRLLPCSRGFGPGVLFILSMPSAVVLSMTVGKFANATASAERGRFSTKVEGFRFEGVDVITGMFEFSGWDLLGASAPITSLRMLVTGIRVSVT